MEIRLLESAEDYKKYAAWLQERSHNSLWQSLQWKEFQERIDRKTKLYAGFNGSNIVCSALVIIDETRGGFCTWDIPRGPMWSGDWQLQTPDWIQQLQRFMEHILQDVKQQQCISLYYSTMGHLPIAIGQKKAKRCTQPEATTMIDLTLSDDELLKKMKPKGRYNIKVAKKKGVRIEQAIDIPSFVRLHDETAGRDGFVHPSTKTYQQFMQIEGSFLLLAYADHYEGHEDVQKPIAGLIGVAYENIGTYYYGASSHDYRALMAPYLLQWEAIQYCKKIQCSSYDLFGIAPPDAENHPWSGVTVFKEKFGGDTVLYPPEQEVVLKPFVKKGLELKRSLLK